jgi:REP element-mobilizing transposase RayT
LIHHVTGHSVASFDAFPDDSARRGFLSLLARTVRAMRWSVLGYCLLPNHYHLLVQTEDPNLGEGMRKLQSRHAQVLGARVLRRGPLWRDRFHSKPVVSGRHVVNAAVYIDTNSVAAGIVGSPEAWRWSSYRANAGLCEPPFWHRVDLLYGHFGGDQAEAPSVYRELVASAVERIGD